MATIVEMINPLTGLPEQVDKLDHTAQEIDDAVGLAPQLSNPNLLDNWYFVNPVNQRGKTSYSASGYTIDRWYTSHSISFGTLTVDQTAGCVTISHNNDGGVTDFYQTLENPVTEIVTLSVLMLNGNLYSATGTLGNISLYTDEIYILSSSPSNVALRCSAGKTISIKAVKMELGTTQTLAHQDANGNWVLNEIPDYGEQLARCQRYRAERKKATGYVSYSSGGVVAISPMAGCSFPTTMRSNPSCAIFAADVAKTANKVSYYSNFESLADGTVASVSADDNGIYSIGLQNSSIQVGTIVEFCYVANAEL